MAPLSLNSTDAYLDWDYRVVSSVIWVPLSIIGISGNLMVILVVMTVRGMKTPTNCYLVSLACADCLFFVSMIPSELSSIHLPDNVFVFGRVGCSLLRFLPFLSINASSLSITAFTVERYIGICHPMKARYICTVKRAQLIIVTIWTFSVLYNSTWLFLTDLKPLNYLDWPDAYQCTFSLSRESYKAIFLIDMFMFYWIPLLLYLILYGVMARTLIKAGVFVDLQPSSTSPNNENGGASKHTSVRNCVNGREPAGVGRLVKSRKIKSSLDSNSGVGIRLQQTTAQTGRISKTDSETSGNGYLRPSASFSGGIHLAPFDSPVIDGRRVSSVVTSSMMIRKGSTPDSTRLHATRRRTDSTASCLSTRSACAMMDSSLDARNSSDANSISVRRSKTTAARESKAYYGDSLNRSRAQVVKMLIVIVVTFALFCLPYRGLVVYNSFTRNPWVEQWYLLFAKTMVMVNSAINPILYNVLSGKFRNAFVLMFKRCFRIQKGSGFRLREGTRYSIVPRTSVSTAVRQQETRYSATSRLSKSRYSLTPGNTVGVAHEKRHSSLCSAMDRKERNALLVPTIALTPDSAIVENGDESQTELLG